MVFLFYLLVFLVILGKVIMVIKVKKVYKVKRMIKVKKENSPPYLSKILQETALSLSRLKVIK